MPQVNRRPKPIAGGHARHPRWFGAVRRTMAEPTKDVWMTLLEHNDRADNPGVVSLGVRLLASETGYTPGAVRNACADLERRGLIVRLADGEYGRRRWRMVLDAEPPEARVKPETRRGRHAAEQTRTAGRFGPRRVTDTTAHSFTDTTAHLGTDSTAHIGALGTDSTAHDRDDARKCADTSEPDVPESDPFSAAYDDSGPTVVDADGWQVSGPPAHLGWDDDNPDRWAEQRDGARRRADPHELNPNSSREYTPGRRAQVTFADDERRTCAVCGVLLADAQRASGLCVTDDDAHELARAAPAHMASARAEGSGAPATIRERHLPE